MRTFWSLVATVAGLVLAANPAAAQTGEFLLVVHPDDVALDQPLVPVGATVGFVDANGDFKAGWATPVEPVYLDLDHDASVTYGDVRLTPFRGYPAGSNVDGPDLDFGLHLSPIAGWVATGAGDTWYLDADNSGAISAGDVRLGGGVFGTRVEAGNGDVGGQLTAIQPRAGPNDRVAVRDLDGDQRYDAGEKLYFDMDADFGAGSRKINAGDVQLAPSGIFRAADGATLGPGTTAGPGTTGATAPADGWRPLDWALVGLAVLNLAGLAILARQARRPKNPFK